MKKLLSTAFLLAGLCVGLATAREPKNYQRPPLDIPPVYRGGDQSPGSIGDMRWFDIFKDPQLQTLIRTALQRNADLRTAVVNVDAERANLGIVHSNELPTITAGGDINTNQISGNGPSFFPGVNIPRTRTFGEALLNLLSFEIDVWGRLRHQTEAARAELRASEADRKAVMTTVVSDVAAGYFNLIELDAELDIDRRTLAARGDSLRIIKLREQGGLATMLDVRTGEQLVETADEAIPETELQIAQTENHINLLLANVPGPVARGQALTEQEPLPEVPAGLPSELLERRPDIQAAEDELMAQHALIASVRAAYFPQISLTGLLGFQSSALSNLFTNGSRQWAVDPGVTIPVFTGGRSRATVDQARARQQLALITYQKTVLTAFSEVSDALLQTSQVKTRRAQQEALVATLKERSRLAYLRYRGGVDSYLNALDADRDLFNAELLLAQARRNELLSLVQLYKALGGGWQL